jgi:hypothetical protein
MTEEQLQARLKQLDQEIGTAQPAAPAPAPKPDLSQMSEADLQARLDQLNQEIEAVPGGISAPEQFAREAFGAATLGFGEEIIAGAKSLVGPESFEEELQKQRAIQERARIEHPTATLTGQIGGTFASAPFAAPAKGAGLAAALAKSAGVGAAIGLGEAKDIKSAEEAVGIAAKGATVGAAFEGAFRGLGKMFKALSPTTLKKTAESRAVKSFKPVQSVQKDLEKKGRVHELGRQILDDKVLSFSPRKTLELAEKGRKEAGEAIGEVVKKYDDLVQDTMELIENDKLMGFVPKDGFLVTKSGDIVTKASIKEAAADSFREPFRKIGQRIRQEAESIKEVKSLRGEYKKLLKMADQFQGEEPTGKLFDLLRREKTALGKKTNFRSETVPQEFQKKLYSILREELEGAASAIKGIEDRILGGKISLDDIADFQMAHGAKNADELIAANTLFSKRADIAELAEKAAARAASNKDLSLTDALAAVGGITASTAIGPIGLVLPVINNIVRKHGNAAAAIGLDKLARMSGSIASTRFAQVLAAAAEKSPNALIATHMWLMDKEPAYRALLDRETPGLGAAIPSDQSPLLRSK